MTLLNTPGRYLSGLFLAFFLATTSLALTQHLPNEEWQKLDGDLVSVMFPQGAEAEARRIAAYLDAYLPAMDATLDAGPLWKPFPVVLSASSHESNGYVGLAPRRSYFYNRPSSFSGSEWLRVLAIHEGRHIQQFSVSRNSPVGATLYVLLGELGPGFLIVALYPDWFLEGDAVLEETLWTRGGRGRMASFSLMRRTHELSGQRDNYYRAYLGTGRDAMPFVSHYDLGYFLVTYFRRHYGNDFFAEVLANTGNSLNWRFSRQILHRTGIPLTDHYQLAMDELNALWQAQQDSISLTTDLEDLPIPEADGWLGVYPLGYAGNQLLTLTAGVRQAPGLAWLDQEGYRFKTNAPMDLVRSYVTAIKERNYSLGGDRLCWVREQAHPRFALASFGNLQCQDLTSGKVTTLSRQEKYLSVAVSPDGNQLAALSFSQDRQVALHLLNDQGDQMAQWSLPYNSYPFDPSIDASGKRLVYSRLTEAGFSLHEFDLVSGEEHTLIAPTHAEAIRGPVYADRWIAYSSDYSGIDQIWLLDRSSGERFLAVQRPYGAYFPVYDAEQNRLVFSDYGPEGERLRAYRLPEQGQNDDWQALADVTVHPVHYFEPLLNDSHTALASLSDTELSGDRYDVSDLGWAEWGVRPYSWGAMAAGEGIAGTVYMTNVLDTLSLGLYADHDFTLDASSIVVDLEYRRWFPVLGLELGSKTNQQLDNGEISLAWRQNQVQASIGLPLAWRSDYRQHELLLHTGLGWNEQRSLIGNLTDDEAADALSLYSFGLTYAQGARGAFWDERLRRFWQTEWQWQGTLPQIEQPDWSRLTGQGQWGLPGLAANHAARLSLSGEHQRGSEAAVYRASDLPGARGYQEPLTREIGATLALDYRMPLLNLDQPLTSAIYLKRLSLGFSADTEWARRQGRERQRSSIGTTVFMPANLLSNRSLVVEPRASLYYLPESERYSAQLSFVLSGF
ncbi:MAG: hypothetical protein LAT65_15210 [Saccharospirillum sp.]|nr:hypothetical protein [Saccharospirillum sp.]